MLSPVLPDEIALANIPRQRWKSVLEIVAFTEQTSTSTLALGYPLFALGYPSRSGMLLLAVMLPWLSLSSASHFVWNVNISLLGWLQQAVFQGFFIVRRVHLAAQVLNVAFWVFQLIWGFATRDVFIIIAFIIFVPFLLMAFALFYRLLAEIAVSILLIPVLLAKQQTSTIPGPAGNNADLAAYGVGMDQETTV